jgi:hypothetical protein
MTMQDSNEGQIAPEIDAPQQPEAKNGTADPRLEQFAAKERQLRKMQQDLATEKQRLTAEGERYKTGYVAKDRLTQDPLSALEEAGITPDKLSELLMNAPNTNDPTVRMLRAEMKRLQDKQDFFDKKQQEETQQRYDQATKQIGREAALLVDSDSNFETIKATGKADEVTKLILEEFNTTGVLLDVKEAAQRVEDRLVEEGMKYASVGKIKSRLAPPADPVEQKPAAPSAQPQVRTITQNMTTSTPTGNSEKDRIARAIAAFSKSKT